MFGICKCVLFIPQLMTGALKIGPCCSSISAEGEREGEKKRRDRKERCCTEVWTRVRCLLIDDDDDDDGETQGHDTVLLQELGIFYS